jgi:LPS-assembly lipoprotein
MWWFKQFFLAKGGLAALLLILALVSGCGFHLRGRIEIPATLNPLHIQAPAGSPVRLALEELLTGSAVRLTATPAEAKLIVRIVDERRASRVAAVDANGKTLAFELHSIVRFDAIAPDGTQKVAAHTFDLTRNFDNPDVEVLGKQLEEELIYQDFAADIADRILMRLRAVLL